MLLGARGFYGLWSALLVVMWALFSVLCRCDFHSRGLRGVLVTRPSWVPSRLLIALQHRWAYLALCHGTL